MGVFKEKKSLLINYIFSGQWWCCKTLRGLAFSVAYFLHSAPPAAAVLRGGFRTPPPVAARFIAAA